MTERRPQLIANSSRQGRSKTGGSGARLQSGQTRPILGRGVSRAGSMKQLLEAQAGCPTLSRAHSQHAAACAAECGSASHSCTSTAAHRDGEQNAEQRRHGCRHGTWHVALPQQESSGRSAQEQRRQPARCVCNKDSVLLRDRQAYGAADLPPSPFSTSKLSAPQRRVPSPASATGRSPPPAACCWHAATARNRTRHSLQQRHVSGGGA